MRKCSCGICKYIVHKTVDNVSHKNGLHIKNRWIFENFLSVYWKIFYAHCTVHCTKWSIKNCTVDFELEKECEQVRCLVQLLVCRQKKVMQFLIIPHIPYKLNTRSLFCDICIEICNLAYGYLCNCGRVIIWVSRRHHFINTLHFMSYLYIDIRSVLLYCYYQFQTYYYFNYKYYY